MIRNLDHDEPFPITGLNVFVDLCVDPIQSRLQTFLQQGVLLLSDFLCRSEYWTILVFHISITSPLPTGLPRRLITEQLTYVIPSRVNTPRLSQPFSSCKCPNA